jgi:hypothetical protein
MTYHEDPNMPRRTEIDPVDPGDPNSSAMMWIGGLLAVFLVVGGIIWATSTNDTTRTASDTPASTTGAGSTTPRTEPAKPADPARTTPTAPSPQAPATNPPATNR